MSKPSKQFEKDVKKAKRQGKDISKLKQVMRFLIEQAYLPVQNRDHKLIGKFCHHRECHISSDWLLIYKITDEEIIFERLGTHSELFAC